MAHRRFQLSENAVGPATLANPATLRPETAPTVATLATLAGQTAENDELVEGEISPASPAALASLDDWQAYFDERAGIREFDGGFPRHEAERLAREDVTAVLGPEPLV